MFEPADGTVVRFTMGVPLPLRGGATREPLGNHGKSRLEVETSPASAWLLGHLPSGGLEQLARQGATFEVATAWDHVVDNDPRVPKLRKVIRFTVAGLSAAAIFIRRHRERGSWSTTLTGDQHESVLPGVDISSWLSKSSDTPEIFRWRFLGPILREHASTGDLPSDGKWRATTTCASVVSSVSHPVISTNTRSALPARPSKEQRAFAA